jgi:hypothetical protein
MPDKTNNLDVSAMAARQQHAMRGRGWATTQREPIKRFKDWPSRFNIIE